MEVARKRREGRLEGPTATHGLALVSGVAGIIGGSTDGLPSSPTRQSPWRLSTGFTRVAPRAGSRLARTATPKRPSATVA